MLTNGDICACKFTQSGAETVSHELSDHSATTGNFGKLIPWQGMHPQELLCAPE